MSVKIKQLFDSVGIKDYKTIKWEDIKSTDIPDKFGVYIIELNEVQNQPVFDKSKINKWLSESGHVTINNIEATLKTVTTELKSHWIQDETILYIGQTSTSAKGLKKRLKDFHSHQPGNKGPHSGGYWIKLLCDLNNFKVHYAMCENAYDVEFKMLLKFVMLTANESDIMKIENLGQYLPFANLTADFDKRHNIKGAIKKRKVKEELIQANL